MICNFRERLNLEYRANVEAFYNRRLKMGGTLLPEEELDRVDAITTLDVFANNGWIDLITGFRKKAKKRMKKRYPNG